MSGASRSTRRAVRTTRSGSRQHRCDQAIQPALLGFGVVVQEHEHRPGAARAPRLHAAAKPMASGTHTARTAGHSAASQPTVPSSRSVVGDDDLVGRGDAAADARQAPRQPAASVVTGDDDRGDNGRGGVASGTGSLVQHVTRQLRRASPGELTRTLDAAAPVAPSTCRGPPAPARRRARVRRRQAETEHPRLTGPRAPIRRRPRRREAGCHRLGDGQAEAFVARGIQQAPGAAVPRVSASSLAPSTCSMRSATPAAGPPRARRRGCRDRVRSARAATGRQLGS